MAWLLHFYCHSILDKKLQKTFALEINNDESKRKQKTIFTTSNTTHLVFLENDFTHKEDVDNSGKSVSLKLAVIPCLVQHVIRKGGRDS